MYRQMSPLKQAFYTTRFCVFDPQLTLRIDELNADLDHFLDSQRFTEWAFITAWNPFAKTLPDEENQRRHEALQACVRAYVCREGEGIGTDPTWAPERSLLILGIPRAEAMEIGRRFEQNAIVCGAKGQAPELVDLFDY